MPRRPKTLPPLDGLCMVNAEVEFVHPRCPGEQLRGVVLEYHSPDRCLPVDPCPRRIDFSLHQEPSLVLAVPYWGIVAGIRASQIVNVVPVSRTYKRCGASAAELEEEEVAVSSS